MDYSSRPQEQIRDHHHHHHHQKPPPSSPYSPLNSPTSNGSTTTNNNGVQTPTSPKLMTPKSTDPNNPYATTFIQADCSNFKHVVQMLTGSSETTSSTKHHHHHPSSPNNINKDPSFSSSSSSSPLSKNFTIPPVKTAGAKKPQQQQGFKLYERRSQNLKNSLMINTLMPNFHHHRNSNSNSPRHHQILSPSVLDFPALTLSPVTPLLNDEHCPPMGNSSSEEDRTIAEKGFYLHPSPRSNNNTPREPEPRLLPLFPVTSPRVSGSTSTTS